MSEKITSIIDAVKELTVLELNELVKAIEEEFGVSAAAPVAVAAAAPGAAAALRADGSGHLRRGDAARRRRRLVLAALSVARCGLRL